jgi:phosphoribosylamine--glycine ligase
MKVLVVGSGGREHALCWSLAASPLTDALYCAPGNAGIAREATCIDLKPTDIEGIVGFATENAIDLVVVGPEAPLVAGLVDALSDAGVKAFGPTAAAAQLEGSKGFMKDLCAEAGIPTAAYRRFPKSEAAAAMAYARELGAPVVIKADGLASGKGVVVCQSLTEAENAIESALTRDAFGEAGSEIVVEDFLEGEEASAFALCDGKSVVMLPGAQDHKRAYDGETGPNTGGMGAYSPAPVLTNALQQRVRDTIIQPAVDAMAARGTPFKGVLYAGLMIDAQGPKLLEFNTRFGDPECQVLMMRLMSDLLPALVAACDGVLDSFDLRWRAETAMCVVVAARGYPGGYAKGEVIGGLDAAETDEETGEAAEDIKIFHAGTAFDDAGNVVSAGGRVLGVTTLGNALDEAHARAYATLSRIDWPGGFYRRDIGWRALKRDTIATED